MNRGRQRGMFLLQNVLAMALFSVGALAVLALSASAKRQSADAHYRAVASMLVADLTARMRIGPRDADALATLYHGQGAGARRFGSDAASVLPGVAASPPAIVVSDDGNVVVTLRWKAPGEPASHQYVAATRIAE